MKSFQIKDGPLDGGILVLNGQETPKAIYFRPQLEDEGQYVDTFARIATREYVHRYELRRDVAVYCRPQHYSEQKSQ